MEQRCLGGGSNDGTENVDMNREKGKPVGRKEATTAEGIRHARI